MADRSTRPSKEDVIDSSSVIVCCGSGGVGKTTTAAVLGLEAARRGRRAVVVTIDPAKRLADALGLEGGLAAEPQRIDIGHSDVESDPEHAGELWAMMLDTAATFDGLVKRHAEDEEQIERILSNAFYRNIAGALSGTQEYMAAETLHQLHGDDRFDLVVVDTPPSRNALDFLEAPGVLARTGFRERADEVIALIRAPETSFVVVATPRHDTIDEAVWFAEQLVEQGVGVTGAVVNRAQPAFGKGSAESAASNAFEAGAREDVSLASLWTNVADLRTMREHELDVIAPLAEIAGEDRLSLVPLLDRDVHDLDGLWTIAGHLFEDGPPRISCSE
ncbi:MAG: ArsA family ATPase [Actinobacteria bacterium]|nr:ArsA family ATPase [Actinomycetota bacterium]